jgi:sugar lactone lactonase YvrE
MLSESVPLTAVVSDTRAILGESPLWHDGRLYWTDVNGAALHCSHAGRSSMWRWDAPSVAVVATTTADRLLVVLADRLVLFDLRTGQHRILAQPSIGWPDRRFNDVTVDPAGRLLVGTMRNNIGPTGEHLDVGDQRGAILAIAEDGEIVSTGITGLGCPNGLAFSPDGHTLYWADSAANWMMAGDYDSATATVSNARSFAAPFARGIPDGSAVDADGCVWNARFGGGCVVRFTPDGAVDDVIDTPMTNPTCVAFGDDDGRTLFVSSASLLAPAGEAAAGAVISFPNRVAGAPRRSFSLEAQAGS